MNENRLDSREHESHVLRCAAPLRFASPLRRSSQRKIPRIGYLSAALPPCQRARIEAFRQGLRELGYVEGKNIVIEWRFAEGKLDRLPRSRPN